MSEAPRGKAGVKYLRLRLITLPRKTWPTHRPQQRPHATSRTLPNRLPFPNHCVSAHCPGDKAPELASNKAVHLEADAYHEAMKDPNAVIIDVRNQYESAIGHFARPRGERNSSIP